MLLLSPQFTAVQFIFGIGVGGEYPVASASANERAESSAALSKRRGETVVLVFSMQGWGNLVNTAVIIGEWRPCWRNVGGPQSRGGRQLGGRLGADGWHRRGTKGGTRAGAATAA